MSTECCTQCHREIPTFDDWWHGLCAVAGDGLHQLPEGVYATDPPGRMNWPTDTPKQEENGDAGDQYRDSGETQHQQEQLRLFL